MSTTTKYSQDQLFVCFDFWYHRCDRMDHCDAIMAIVGNPRLHATDQWEALDLLCASIKEYRDSVYLDNTFNHNWIMDSDAAIRLASPTARINVNEDPTPLGPCMYSSLPHGGDDYQVWTRKDCDALFERVFGQ